MKNQHFLLITAGLIVLTFCQIRCSRKPPQLGKDPVKDVIAAMTLEEKAYFLTGTGMSLPGDTRPKDAPAPGAPAIGETQKIVPGAAGTTYEISRLGIPAIVMADGPAGLRISPTRPGDENSYYCTAFPVSTLVASTWDPTLAFEIGKAMGNEVLEYGADILLAPAMNIHRNPLCGRNFEYYSEDPLVTGKIAASFVNGVESEGVGTSIKHFAANNAETNRNALDTYVSERALREIYLEGFRIAVEEAQPWTVMSSYNLINGVPASENRDLLTTVLRDDWGFKGFVMTDWFGGKDAAAQMIAGNELLMPGTVAQANAIIKGVQEGKLTEAQLDKNIERILNVLVTTPHFKGRKPSNKPDMKTHAQLARAAASEGMVLLKNESGGLPLATGSKLAAFGNTSYEIITGGTGSGDVNEAYSISLVNGLKDAGYVLSEDLQSRYLQYINSAKSKLPKPKPFMGQERIEEMPAETDAIVRLAASMDAALITIGRNSGEGFDRKVDADFNLTQTETALIRNVSQAFHAKGKKVIVVLNIGGVIETDSWRKYPDSILLAWQAGQETGNSIADVLSGKITPSGKLATTFPAKYEDTPSSRNFPGKLVDVQPEASKPAETSMMASFLNPKSSRVVYEEGVYVGYRYYETFGVKPAYEFGYGLSYTVFEYGKPSLSSTTFSNEITITLDVKNTGKVPGKEIVQLYLGAPARKLDKPVLELKGFAKTRLLNPGEVQRLSFVLKPRQLASFDPAGSSWIAEAGTYNVKIGSSSRDIRQTASFDLSADLVVKKESVALVPKTKIQEIKR